MSQKLIKNMKDGHGFTKTESSHTIYQKTGYNKKEKEVVYRSTKSNYTYIRPDNEKGFPTGWLGKLKAEHLVN